MYEQSKYILDEARFEQDCHMIVVRFQERSSTVCYGLVRLKTFTRLTGHLQDLHTVPPTFVRVTFHTIYIDVRN